MSVSTTYVNSTQTAKLEDTIIGFVIDKLLDFSCIGFSHGSLEFQHTG